MMSLKGGCSSFGSIAIFSFISFTLVLYFQNTFSLVCDRVILGLKLEEQDFPTSCGMEVFLVSTL